MTVMIPSVRPLKTNLSVWDNPGGDNGGITGAYSAVGIGGDVDFCRSSGPRLEHTRTSSTAPPSRSIQTQQQCTSPIRNVESSTPFLVSDDPRTTPELSLTPFSPPFPLRLPTALSQCHPSNQKEERKTRNPRPTPKPKSYSYPSPIRKPRDGYARPSAERWMKNSKVWAKKNQQELSQSCPAKLQQPHNKEPSRDTTAHTSRRFQRGVPRPPSPISSPKQVASNGGPMAGDGYRKTGSGFAALPLLVSLRPDDGQEVWV